MRDALRFTLYTLHFTLFTLHFALYTLHFTLCILHFAFCTFHFALCIVSCIRPSDNPLEEKIVSINSMMYNALQIWVCVPQPSLKLHLANEIFYEYCDHSARCIVQVSYMLWCLRLDLLHLSLFQLLETLQPPPGSQPVTSGQIFADQMAALNLCKIRVSELHVGVSTVPRKYLLALPCFNSYFHHIWHTL